MQNLGIELSRPGNRDANSLPLTARAHAGYKTGLFGFSVLHASLGMMSILPDGVFKSSCGLEYEMFDVFYLRSGLRLFDSINTWDMGAGFVYKEKAQRFALKLDYVFMPIRDFSPVHTFALGVKYYPEKAEVHKTVIDRKPKPALE